jgi:hypothetical protein
MVSGVSTERSFLERLEGAEARMLQKLNGRSYAMGKPSRTGPSRVVRSAVVFSQLFAPGRHRFHAGSNA